METPEFQADCERCQGLCCVTLAFDRGEWFAFDKAPGERCRHLRVDNRCAIHASRSARGQAGCAQYDCYGAGQRVSQLFAGRSWRDDSDTAERMFSVFTVLAELNRLRSLLHSARKLELPEAQAAERHSLALRLESLARGSESAIRSVDVRRQSVDVQNFLRSLRDFVGTNTPRTSDSGARVTNLPWRASCSHASETPARNRFSGAPNELPFGDNSDGDPTLGV